MFNCDFTFQELVIMLSACEAVLKGFKEEKKEKKYIARCLDGTIEKIKEIMEEKE